MVAVCTLTAKTLSGADESLQMASPPESCAASKVFAIPELLEMILLETDEIALFVLQSVNKTFHGMITGSTAIKSRMCLLPTADHRHLEHVLAKNRVAWTTFPFSFDIISTKRVLVFEIELPCQ